MRHHAKLWFKKASGENNHEPVALRGPCLSSALPVFDVAPLGTVWRRCAPWLPVSQILFGTDFPFRRAEEHVEGVAGCGISSEDLAAISDGNAERLLAIG